MRWMLLWLGLTVIYSACSRKKEPEFSFYHWKSKALYSDVIKDALEKANTKTIYMHYFDVDTGNDSYKEIDRLFPTYVLSHVDQPFSNYEIIPVIYIVNSALKNANIESLSSRIHKLIDEISQFRFQKTLNTIQLDCDWTSATRENYFTLIKLLKKHYDVSVTIRLHQIKYKDETGIPPIDKGTLMLYNIGDLENEKQNSILDPVIVSQYIGTSTTYPIELEVALPLFSQTVLINNNHQVRIINGADPDSLQNDGKHFRFLGNHLYETLQDTLYKGFYLSKGYRLKTEEVTATDLITSYAIVKQSRMDLGGIIFYHLDEEALRKVNLDRILNQL